MGWFTRSRRKKKQAEKEDIWERCPGCSAHIFKDEWHKSLRVCPQCNYHDRLTCDERIALLTDERSFSEMFRDVVASDPLKFVDAKGSYAAKTQATREKTGLSEAVKTGRARVEGIDIALAVMDFRFVGGSLGSGTGEKILRIATLALKRKIPLVVVSASGGARMQEGIVSLMQMAKTAAGISKLHAAKIPYISILTNPTLGGVSASYAMVGDVHIAEAKSLIGFAGRRVIEQTIRQKLPDDFQTAEYMLEHGLVDIVVNRSEMKDTLHRVLQYWSRR
jgi:acetyl-CoA carboxylase carboxyl transferase subunit beta